LTLGISLGFIAQSGAATPPPQAVIDALTRANAAVVGVQVTAAEGARSAQTLGRQRSGSGVVIGADGLVLTIGYLMLEADTIQIVTQDNKSLPARAVAYDLATGFGLVRPLLPMRGVVPVALGSHAELKAGDALMAATGGEDGDVNMTQLVSKRPFSGYWEYHIEAALFTSPPIGNHSGAPLFNQRGELLGIGSLFVGNALGDTRRLPGNMFVPVDLLKPIFTELRERGASRASTRPWLGVNCAEADGIVRVIRVSRDSPAEDAGLQPGDEIARVDGTEVHDLETFYKTLWKRSTVEGDVRIDINRGSRAQSLTVRSIDRMKALVRPGGI
jgi:serine protease Do